MCTISVSALMALEVSLLFQPGADAHGSKTTIFPAIRPSTAPNSSDTENIPRSESLSVVPTTTARPTVNEDNGDNGFPCPEDHFCSQSQKRCRRCSIVEVWCNDTSIIHEKYAACEKFCIGVQTKKATETCTEKATAYQWKVSQLTAALHEQEENLAETEKRVEELGAECSRDRDGMQRQLHSKSELNAELNGKVLEQSQELEKCRAQATQYEELNMKKEKADKLNFHLIIGIAVISALLVILSLTLVCVCIRGASHCRTQPDAGGRRAGIPEISTLLDQNDEKRPVQVHRNSAYFPDTDMVLPNGVGNPNGVLTYFSGGREATS